MQNLPNDIIAKILADPCIPIDTRLHFKKEFGMKVHKLQVQGDLVNKLNRVMQYRQPPQPPHDIEKPLYDTSYGGIYNWPPQKDITVCVTKLHVPQSTDISYSIHVRKRRQIFLYIYYICDGEWRSHLSKVPL